MVAAVVAAAGAGDRLRGEVPKAFVELAGRPLAAWSIAALAESTRVERLVVAAPPGYEGQLDALVTDAAPQRRVEVVPGGPSRSRSVAEAVRVLSDATVIVVHDAARPLVRPGLVDRCIEQLERWGCDAAIAAARATDAIKEADPGGRVLATLERSRLWAVQTPQAFRAEALRDALDKADLDRAYDDAQLVEEAGGDVRIVEAPRENFKVTTRLDLRLAEFVLKSRASNS
jgi:2-C-methyl-D-erythritol 4-phosphate cytidylyltransferase